MRVVVSGASGTIGNALCRSLESDGHEVVRLVRREPSGANDVRWDPVRGELDARVVAGADGVVNLNGVSIGASRWTDRQREAIRSSRLTSTGTLARAIAAADPKPRVFVSKSAVGYYGNRGDEACTETTSPGDDFLARLCVDWEAATAPAAGAGVRTVVLRNGVVLTPEHPPLSRMLLPFKLGLGGRIGSGEQWMSWIAMNDEVRVIRRAIEDDSLSGPANSTSPEPVRQRDFATTLGRVLGRPTFLPTPVLALKAVYGSDLVQHLLVEGQRVVPARFGAAGFEFERSDLEGALRAMLSR
jgi:uncharacterized protein (TIGR01777 family)